MNCKSKVKGGNLRIQSLCVIPNEIKMPNFIDILRERLLIKGYSKKFIQTQPICSQSKYKSIYLK